MRQLCDEDNSTAPLTPVVWRLMILFSDEIRNRCGQHDMWSMEAAPIDVRDVLFSQCDPNF
jgi:hypothetical protein